jgi:hypothetical protein
MRCPGEVVLPASSRGIPSTSLGVPGDSCQRLAGARSGPRWRKNAHVSPYLEADAEERKGGSANKDELVIEERRRVAPIRPSAKANATQPTRNAGYVTSLPLNPKTLGAGSCGLESSASRPSL